MKLSAVARVRLKVKVETRDLSLADGDVAYTGYGFKPTGLIITSFEPNFANNAIGAVFSTTNQFMLGADGVQGSALVDVWNNSNEAWAVIKSYDDDGFTLTWEKSGSPTGTLTMIVFAFQDG